MTYYYKRLRFNLVYNLILNSLILQINQKETAKMLNNDIKTSQQENLMAGDTQNTQDNDFKQHLMPVKKVSYRQQNVKWLLLVIVSFSFFGSDFIHDIPQVLYSYLTSTETGNMGLSTTEFNYLYSIYSVPNIVIPLFAGLIIDKLGLRQAFLITTCIVCLGQGICWYGTSQNSFNIYLSGRAVFGLVSEVQITAANYIINVWFYDWISLAYGIYQSIQIVGQSVNQFFTLPIAQSRTPTDIALPNLVGTYFCAFSIGCALIVVWMDYISDKREGKLGVKNEEAANDRVSCEAVKSFNKMFWFMVGIAIFSDGTTWTLYAIQNAILQARFGINEDTASFWVGMHFILQIFLRPLVGYLTDQKGYRAHVLMFHCFLQIVFGFILMFYPFNSSFMHGCQNSDGCLWPVILAYTILAVSSSCMVIFWSCVPLLIPEEKQGTAYGIMMSLENVLWVVFNSIVGWIVDSFPVDRSDEAQFWATAFITLLILCSFFCCAGLAYFDKDYGYVLTTGFVEEIKEAEKEATKLGMDTSQITDIMNRSLADNVRTRSFISGKRVRTKSKASEAYNWERSRCDISQGEGNFLNNLSNFTNIQPVSMSKDIQLRDNSLVQSNNQNFQTDQSRRDGSFQRRDSIDI